METANYDPGHKIDCPISWCEGLLDGHGGDGESPERWYHSNSEEFPGGYGHHGYAQQVGQKVKYFVSLDVEGEYTEMSLRYLAAHMFEIATILSSRAGLLGALNQ